MSRYIDIKLSFRKVIYIIKVLTFLSNAVLANLFLLINYTCLIVSKTLAII